jgi:hypothetical protein
VAPSAAAPDMELAQRFEPHEAPAHGGPVHSGAGGDVREAWLCYSPRVRALRDHDQDEAIDPAGP